MAAISQDQIDLIRVIVFEFVKFILAIVAVYVFITLLNEFISAETVEMKQVYGAADGIFGIIIMRVYWHYFPRQAKTSQ